MPSKISEEPPSDGRALDSGTALVSPHPNSEPSPRGTARITCGAIGKRQGGPHIFPKRLQPSSPRPLDQIIKEQKRYIVWDRPCTSHVYNGSWNPHWILRNGEGYFSHWHVKVLLDFYIDKNMIPITKGYKIRSMVGGAWNFLWVIHQRESTLSTPATAVQEDGPSTLPADTKLPQQFVLRLGQPHDPYYKTESEVATMCFVRDHGVPVPTVYYFDSSAANPLGLEFIIMEFIVGTTASAWVERQADLANQCPLFLAGLGDVLEQVEGHVKKLENVSFDAIGSIYYDWDGDTGYFVGPMVDNNHFAEPWVTAHGINRGPFPDMKSYLEALLDMWEQDAADERLFFDRDLAKGHGRNNIPNSTAGILTNDPRAVICTRHTVYRDWYQPGHCDTIRERVDLVRGKLFPLLEKNLPWILDPLAEAGMDILLLASSEQPDEPAMRRFMQPHLFHHDLHPGNIMVDAETATVVAFLDWEGSRLLPGPAREPVTVTAKLLGKLLANSPQCERLFWVPGREAYKLEEMIALDAEAVGNLHFGRDAACVDYRFRPCKWAVTGRAMAMREVLHLVQMLPRWERSAEMNFASVIEYLEEKEALVDNLEHTEMASLKVVDSDRVFSG